MKKFLDKIKAKLQKKKTPADTEQEIKDILAEGAEQGVEENVEEAPEFHEEEVTIDTELPPQQPGESTSPNIAHLNFDVQAQEGMQDETDEEDDEDITIPMKEMKLGDVSTELTNGDQEFAEPAMEEAIPDDVPPIPGMPLTKGEGTQEIKIDPRQLQYLRDNDVDLKNMGEEDIEDGDDSSFKTMTLPVSNAQKGFKKWLDLAQKKTAPLVALARQQYARWQQQRIAQGRGEFSWDRLVEDLYRVEMRPTIHRFFVGALVASAAYGMGKLTAFLIKGAEERVKPVSTSAMAVKPIQYPLGAIKTANLFNTTLEKGVTGDGKGAKKERDHSRKVCKEASRGTSLPLELTNTIVLQDSVKSVASVAVRGEKEIMNVREGDNIQSMAQVGKINRLSLVIKNLSSGECEFIENKELQKQERPLNVIGEREGKKLMQKFSSQDIQNEGNKFKINKAFRDKMLENVGEILTQARAIQMKNPDGSLAFKMTEIVPGSIYSQLNIRDEDIITKINGKEIASLNDIMSMFGSIKSIDQLSITVMREGNEVEMDYKFE